MNEGTESAFRLWLKATRGNSDSVIRDKISRCRRVERDLCCDLDELFDQGRIERLLELLCCSPSGEPRHNIRFEPGANPVRGTASIKNAVVAYLKFRRSRASLQ